MAIAITAGRAAASPNAGLDDPAYEAIDQRELAGELPVLRGGLAPLSQARIAELLPGALPPPHEGWWLLPIDRAALRLDLAHDGARPYSTPAHPRDLAGAIALSCEGQEGRPCGHGAGAAAELDAAAGYRTSLAAAVRLRAGAGADRATELAVDRAYVTAELGPVAAELGRDVLAIGPPALTQAGWSTNPPPLDQLRLSSARPFDLGASLRGHLIYVVGRLADPQTYPGDLVSIARAELGIGDRVALGAMQLLQLGGDGAPRLDAWDFVLEHLRRRDPSATASDSSNRRFGGDASARFDALGGLRVTYQLIFEDIRKHIADAVRYDADHVLDVETRWLTVELQRTGQRSYEHTPRLTGFTSGGRIAGDPLGPAAEAITVVGRITTAWGTLAPWTELAQLGSDTYRFVDHGPIERTARGPAELRLRLGVRARIPLGPGLELAPEIAVEDVERAAFVPGARRDNAMVRALLTWRPATAAGRAPGM